MLSNPPTRALGHSGVLTTGLAPGVGHLTTQFVKSPTLPGGGGVTGVGHEIDQCIYSGEESRGFLPRD